MKTTRAITRLIAALAIIILTFAAGKLRAQTQIYSQDFETDTTTNWVINVSAGEPSTITSAAWFNFDYSKVGIPPAPHTTDGSTHGLKMVDNCGAGGTGLPAISVSPTNLSVTGNFDMHCDMWLNYNGAGIAGVNSTNGGNGSTILGGMGYGTAGTTVQGAGSADSVFCAITTDGGSSADYRLYAPNYSSSYTDIATNLLGYVYAAATNATTASSARNNTCPSGYYTLLFPTNACPAAQTNLYPQQTGLVAGAGTIAFKWHDVELKKIANVITYYVDGHLIATADALDAGNPAGTQIHFLMSDINATGSTDVQATNLQFMLVDNIRITNFPNVVTVSATQPNASEVGPTTGTFTVTRTSSGQPLTVYYAMSGTATNGLNYQTLSGSVTFAALDTATNITITPIADGVTEATMTAIINITPDVSYVGAGSATIFITDGDTPTIDITSTRSQAYGRYATDFILYHLNRRGLLTAPDLTVNLTYAGTAIGGTDYTVTNSVLLPSGSQGVDFAVYPVYNPAFTGNRTVIINVASGSGYDVGTGPATGTIIDSEYAPSTLVFTNALTGASDAVNWAITYGTGDPTNNASNYEVNFGFNLASAVNAPVPPPPGGATTALHLTCNKDVTPGAGGAVNVYYTNVLLSGNYAVRFNMNLVEGSALDSATEGAIFGINHSGSLSNWWYGSGPITTNTYSSDGQWYFVAAQGAAAGAGDYQEFTGLGGTNGNAGWTRLLAKSEATFADIFKNNPGPFTTVDGTGAQASGIPANAPPVAYDASTWSDVEIMQSNKVVTLSINHTAIFTYTNTTVWTNGYLMLGYTDPYSSVGNSDAGVYYANLRVVQLPTATAVNITGITASGSNVIITFTTTSTADTTGSFTIVSSATVSGAYTSTGASIMSLGSQVFQATVPQNGAQQFYRILHP